MRKGQIKRMFYPKWSTPGWRGNGDDASPSTFRNPSSGSEEFLDGDPRILWAEALEEKIIEKFPDEKNPMKALADFIGEEWLSYAWPGALFVIQEMKSPDSLDEDSLDEVERRIYDKLNPPAPFTLEERSAAQLAWRRRTGYKGFTENYKNPLYYSEEILLEVLNRLL